MIFFPSHTPGEPAVILFGHGLVGRSVSDALNQGSDRPSHGMTYNWQDAAQRQDTLRRLKALVKDTAEICIVWSAGRAGFGSTQSEMAVETTLLQEGLEFVSSLVGPQNRVSFHFVSSAGGLFEGMTDVTSTTPAAPLRPYGHEKLIQETLVADIANANGFTFQTYRLSSIYGFAPKSRLGLISALIMNALNDTVTQITGDVDTLRDYVFVADVGAFIASQIKEFDALSQTPLLLASGQSASIADIVALVRSGMTEPLTLEYQARATNKAHMSFDPESLPKGWAPVPLAQGISQTIQLVRNGQNR